MDFDFGIAGKKYLVTGASSGIGQAAAILISKLGGTVILNGRNEERLNQTLSQMEGTGHHIMPFDLTNLGGIKGYVKDCIRVDGQIFDGLVFSTGVCYNKPIRAETIENLHKIMTVNFYSYFAIIKEFSSRKVMKDNASIVAVSSGAATYPDKSQLGYSCSKIALDTASDVIAQELVSRKIRVNTVRPGMVDTPMTEPFFRETPKDKLKERYQLGIMYPNDIANLIVFLLSTLSKKITGQHIYLSGGNYGGGLDYLNFETSDSIF